MPPPRTKFASEYVGKQVFKARKNKGWTQADLAAQLVELGFTGWRQTKVAKIEVGAMARLPLDDVLALAAALDVQFLHLLAPDTVNEDGEVVVVDEIAIAPKLKRSPSDFRAWLRGFKPLSPGAERTYWAGPLVPEDEWRDVMAGTAPGLTATWPNPSDKEDDDAR
jgi:transcriptional regulator with XRE-family HTH domain